MTIDIEGDNLVIYPGRDGFHRIVVPSRSIEYIEFTEPHGSVATHRVHVKTRTNGWGVDLVPPEGAAVAKRVADWWVSR